MNRLQKKCLIASSGMHLFLFLMFLFGSAFVPKSKPKQLPALKIVRVPDILVDSAMVGGGGNPKLPPSEEKVKGNTLRPQPKPPEPTPKPPAPKPEAKKAEPKAPPKKPEVKPEKKFELTPVDKTGKDLPKVDILAKLKPSTEAERAKERARLKAAAEAKQAEAEAKQLAADRKALANALAHSTEELKAGFKDGTVVEAYGPGGAAYANYALWVQQVYEDAWVVPNDLTDEDATAKVVVVIARTGHVIASKTHIERRSRNLSLDKSVERVLQRVTFIREFPEGTHDQERTFIINFNLKAKQLG